MTACVFCQIISGEIPSAKIYEDENILAFLDITQTTKGHTLVIPKQHIRNIFEMPEETAATIGRKLPRLAAQIKEKLGASGMNIINNNEAVAYQSVFHAHIHLIPRYSKTDDFAINFSNHQADYPSHELLSIAESLKIEN
ncbi:MAG: HIT family protein [Streptococcaceae bacterium]|jgi:histidine triad (HIT) family protein|nr:HIT family protein [Streptococcaceae bacterium]